MSGIQISDQQRDQITKPVTDGLKELIFGNPGLFNDRPGFIASNDERGPVQSAVRAISQANCRIWAARDKTGYSPGVNATNAELCGPYLQDIGEWPGDGTLEPAFEGGQCEERYLFDITGTLPQGVNTAGECIGTQNLFVVAGVWGPISGFSRGPGDCTGGPGGGTFTLLCTCFGSSGGPRQSSPVTIAVAQPAYTATPSNFRRIDNNPDDCGNPPPVYTPPPPGNPPVVFDPSFEINIPGIGPVDVNVDVNPDGSIEVCVEQLQVCYTIDGPPGSEGGGGGGAAGGDGLPGTDDAVGAPAFSGGTGADGEDVDFGPPPEGRVWVGCLARYVAPSGIGVIPGTAGSNRAYTQVVGNLSLVYEGGRSDAQQVRSEWAQAFRPVTALVVGGVFVNALPGVVVTIRPVSAIVCPESTCEG